MIRCCALFLLFTACSPEMPACRVGADCASGVCSSLGMCVNASGGGSAQGGGASSGGGTSMGGGMGGGGAGGGSGGGADSGVPDSGLSPTCQPNRDGSLTRAEVPLAAGLHATFRVATDVSKSTAPDTADGGTTWDLAKALSGDHSVLAETLPLSGQWFESDFAGATYVSKLSEDSDLLGVFEVTNDALLLRGVVSATQSFAATKLTYSPPAKMLAFPMSVGSHWSTTSTVSGQLNGGFWTQTEAYDSHVDKRGTLLTPFSSFDVLRVQTVLTRTIGFVDTVTRTDAFATECFGTVALLTSQSDESHGDWSDQAEVRRLAP